MQAIHLLQTLPGQPPELPALARLAPEPLVICWPAPTNNPYLRLLCRPGRIPARYCAGDIDAALAAAEVRGPERATVFHQHWLSKVFQEAKKPGQARKHGAAYLEKLERFKALGGHLVWTLHNGLEHETRFPKVETDFRALLAELSDVIHVHDAGSLDEIEGYAIPPEKVVVLHHGHYVDAYPDTVTRDDARAALGLGPDDDVCLHLGNIGAYKGVDTLVAAFRVLHAANPRAKLVVAGAKRGRHDPFAGLEPPLSDAEQAAILLFDAHVADELLQVFFRAADLSVVPYKRSLTSGTLLLSLSFDLPAIVGETAMTRGVLFDPGLGATIPMPAGPDAVAAALAAAFARKRAGALAIAPELAGAFRDRYAWEDYSLKVLGRFVEVPPPPPPPPGPLARLLSRLGRRA